MNSLNLGDSRAVCASIGLRVSLAFIKEGKHAPVTGTLEAVDPESGSVVIAQMRDGEAPAKLVLIPGTSVQSLHILERGPTSPAQESFYSCAASATGGSAEKMHRSMDEGAAEKQPARTLSEVRRMFDTFVQGRRRRVIEALNKCGIEFREEPYVFVQQTEERPGLETTVIVAEDTKIFPPYGKVDIVGGSKAKCVLRALTFENTFDDRPAFMC